MEERTFGGELGTCQDVTIILLPKGGSTIDQKLALIHLHSHVLSSHSKYFNTCFSEGWKKPVCPFQPMEFALEVQTDVQHYFDCFSNMCSPLVKSFESVRHGVELLKVASQIDFQGLVERISLYLSSTLWTKEDEIRVREYSASPDFPRIYLKDLVERLGLDETQEDREKQLFALIRQCIRCSPNAASDPKESTLPAFLKAIGCAPPSDYSRKVFAIVSQEAKDMFFDIGKDWNGKVPRKSNTAHIKTTIERIQAMCRILEALLQGQVAEELVQAIVHLDAIPTYVNEMSDSRSQLAKYEFAKVVFLMYEEVVAGKLLLRPPERKALLANWHKLLKVFVDTGDFRTSNCGLVSDLALEAADRVNRLAKREYERFHRQLPVPGFPCSSFTEYLGSRGMNSSVFKFETIDPVLEDSRREV